MKGKNAAKMPFEAQGKAALQGLRGRRRIGGQAAKMLLGFARGKAASLRKSERQNAAKMPLGLARDKAALQERGGWLAGPVLLARCIFRKRAARWRILVVTLWVR